MGKKKVREIYIHDDMGLVFVTQDKKEYAYKVFRDASEAICEIMLEELPKKKGKR